MTFGIEFLANPYYEVRASSREEALEKAMRWYEEYMPSYRIAEAPADEDGMNILENVEWEYK